MADAHGDKERELVGLASVDEEFGVAATFLANAHRTATGRDAQPYQFPDTSVLAKPIPHFVPARGWRRITWGLVRKFGPGVATIRLRDGRTAFVPRGCVLAGNVEDLLDRCVGTSRTRLFFGNSVHYEESLHGALTHQLRPGWSSERLMWHCYVGEVLVADKSTVKAAGGKRFLRGRSAHDRALRLSDAAESVVRVDGLLYAMIGGESAAQADHVAVADHCARTGVDAECTPDPAHGVVRVKRRAHRADRIAVIIPTRGTSAHVLGSDRVLVEGAIRSLLQCTNLVQLEFIVVADSETPPDARAALANIPDADIRIIDYDSPFNFAEKVNIGALSTDAEFLLFMNDDVEVSNDGTIEALLAYFCDDSIGQVAPILCFEDGTVQSAGHLLNPAPFDLYRGYSVDLRGGDSMLHAARDVSSAIAAFTLTRSQLFREVGGLCMQFPRDYNDVDFSLKLAMLGKRTVVTPLVRCFHFESKTRTAVPEDESVALLGRRWQHVIENDPHGNPHLAPFEFIWMPATCEGPDLDAALGAKAEWDGREWGELNERDDRHLHRTKYFPKWVRLER